MSALNASLGPQQHFISGAGALLIKSLRIELLLLLYITTVSIVSTALMSLTFRKKKCIRASLDIQGNRCVCTNSLSSSRRTLLDHRLLEDRSPSSTTFRYFHSKCTPTTTGIKHGHFRIDSSMKATRMLSIFVTI